MLYFHSEKENDEADSIDAPSAIRKASSVTNLAEMDSNKRKSAVKTFYDVEKLINLSKSVTIMHFIILLHSMQLFDYSCISVL